MKIYKIENKENLLLYNIIFNMNKDQLIQLYNIYIYERVQTLLNSGKTYDDFDYKSDLHKIFE
jgi:hypothetical protein